MAILIDGVKMPGNCHECDSLGFSDIVGLECPEYDFNKRPKGCPLVQPPEHHGDLKDVDAIANGTPLVRCENCKYCHKEDEFEYWCYGLGSPARLVKKEDFCSYGCKTE